MVGGCGIPPRVSHVAAECLAPEYEHRALVGSLGLWIMAVEDRVVGHHGALAARAHAARIARDLMDERQRAREEAAMAKAAGFEWVNVSAKPRS